MLKIYTDKSFLTEAYRRQVFPLLFDLVYVKDKETLLNFEIVESIETSDVVIIPIAYQSFINNKKAYHYLITLAKKNQKKIWIYTAGDFGVTISQLDYVTFRLGGFKSKLPPNTQILPSFINDPYHILNKEFNALSKDQFPTIGFVGHAESGIKKYAKEYLAFLKLNLKQSLKSYKNDFQSFYPSGYKRANYLQLLKSNKNLTTNFIFRQKYRAGVTSLKSRETTTQEFYNNMYHNAYTLCLRGVGNFSVRFYETLAMGRIPVLIDTDCKLPLEEIIDWSKHVLIIKGKEIANLDNEILRFHASLTPNQFKELQESNRQLWINYLKRTSYFKQINSIFTS